MVVVVGVQQAQPGGVTDGGVDVGDVLGQRVLAADGACVDAVGLAGLGKGVVPAVEVLALLQVLRKLVFPRGQFAVQAEQTLLFGREGLRTGRRM